jgi:hypothetical protein
MRDRDLTAIFGIRINAFAYRARGIAAAHRKRLNEQVREGVQQYVLAAGE